MRIFVIAGKAGSGKGEVAKLIKEYYIYKMETSVITGYSKYLKKFALEMTEWDGQEGNKPRKFLQEFGSKIRGYDKNYFTRRMVEDINVYELGDVKNVIIEDARMPEEIERLKENYDEVYSIYVVNQFAPSKLSLEEQAHITEIALEDYDDFDYTIANDSLDELKTKVFKYLEGIK